MTYCHTSCHRTWSIGEEHNGQTPSFTTISKPRIWFIMQECLKNKQIWTPHIGQSLSFKVIKQTVINGCSVVLSMNNYFNLHTTSLWSQPSWAIQWSATLKSISTVLPTWRHMICMLFRYRAVYLKQIWEIRRLSVLSLLMWGWYLGLIADSSREWCSSSSGCSPEGSLRGAGDGPGAKICRGHSDSILWWRPARSAHLDEVTDCVCVPAHAKCTCVFAFQPWQRGTGGRRTPAWRVGNISFFSTAMLL